MPELFGGHNLPPLVEIGLTEVPTKPAIPGPPFLSILRYSVVDAEILDSRFLQIEDSFLNLFGL